MGLLGIDGMGQAALGALAGFFGVETNVAIVDNLTAHLTIEDAEAPTSNSPVAGKTVVFTGKKGRSRRRQSPDGRRVVGVDCLTGLVRSFYVTCYMRPFCFARSGHMNIIGRLVFKGFFN